MQGVDSIHIEPFLVGSRSFGVGSAVSLGDCVHLFWMADDFRPAVLFNRKPHPRVERRVLCWQGGRVLAAEEE